MPKVSIVVPVYNSGKYLDKCLESIRNQTLEDFECILVDDGSSDSSGSICDSFSCRDKRFSVIHLENGGVSRARNHGIRKAEGEYIGFVDSDDWIDPDMFGTLYRAAVDNKAEISICNVHEDRVKCFSPEMDSAQAKICMYSDGGFQGYSMNKLVKKELFDSFLYDESLGCYEDLVLFHQLFSVCNKVVWTNLPLYHYFRREGSITADYIFDKAKQAGIERLRQLMGNETDPEVVKAMESYLFRYYLETAVDYVSHRNVDAEGFRLSYTYVLDNARHIGECGLRRKIWMGIIRHDCLKRIYWWVKGVPSLK